MLFPNISRIALGSLCLCILSISHISWGQSTLGSLGMPLIQHYDKATYLGGTQNWQIDQDEAGFIYVANNEGMLVFDGNDWQLYPLPNQTITRSLAVDTDGKIYVGGQNEIGYFQANSRGFLEYHDLRDFLAEEFRNFGDVWRILISPEGIFFHCAHVVMRFHDGKIEAWDSLGELIFMGQTPQGIYVQSKHQGIYQFAQQRWVLASSLKSLFPHRLVSTIAWGHDSVLLVTAKAGIWVQTSTSLAKFPTDQPEWIYSTTLNQAIKLDKQTFVVASMLGGIRIFNLEGHCLEVLTKQTGLLDENVLAIFLDQQHNLWLGLNYGIDYVALAAPFRLFSPDQYKEGTAYAAFHQGEFLYWGTSNGLYAIPTKDIPNTPKNEGFSPVENASGQIWSIQSVHDKLLVGHHESLYVIEGLNVTESLPANGLWKIIPNPNNPNQLIAGTYTGLAVYSLTENGIQFSHTVAGFHESSRFLQFGPQNTLWVSHPYKGIFQLIPTLDFRSVKVKSYDEKDGLPSILGNHIFNIRGELLVGTSQGVFQYDAQQDKFFPHLLYNELLGQNQNVSRLFEAQNGNVWVVADQQVGLISIDDQGLEREISCRWIPWLTDKLVGGFELIYQLDEENIFMGLEKGFVHLQPQHTSQDLPPSQTVISGVYGTGVKDTLLLGPFLRDHPGETHVPMLSFPRDSNSFRFVYSSPNQSPESAISYQFRLLGQHEKWSAWTSRRDKEYTNLPAGNFIFQVRSRINQETPGPIRSFSFAIAPAWYETNMMKGIYSSFALLVMLSLIIVPQVRFKKEREALESVRVKQKNQLQEEIAATEQELVALKNQKLETEIQFKNQELVTATMHLVQKNGILTHIKNSLAQLEKVAQAEPVKQGIKELVKQIGFDEQLDRDWEQFAFHFDRVHAGFLRRLQKTYPQLSPKDRRLCAYLRLNLTSKEIAPLLNISVRGVEISRYRLRKKLELPHDTNLSEFMSTF